MIALRSEHRRFALWAAAVLIVVLPLWWLWGADLVASLLRPLFSLSLRATGMNGVVATADGWSIQTGFTQVGGGEFVYPLRQDMVRRYLLGFALLLAFLAAPPRTDRPVRSALIGTLVLSAVFLLSLTAFVWGELAPILNPALAPAGALRPVSLSAAPLHPALAQTVLLGRYAGASILPLLTALLVWASISPKAVRALWGSAFSDVD